MTCRHDYRFSRYCGAHVCEHCGDHRGLARCYCGWSTTRPGEGRRELEDMGETIDPDPEVRPVDEDRFLAFDPGYEPYDPATHDPAWDTRAERDMDLGSSLDRALDAE